MFKITAFQSRDLPTQSSLGDVKLWLLKGCESFEVLYLAFLAGRAKFNFSSGQCMEFNMEVLCQLWD